jgi:hypothetical protein
VGHFERWVVASPDYLAQSAALSHPGICLSTNACVSITAARTITGRFRVTKSPFSSSSGRLQSNNADILREAPSVEAG